MFQHVAITKGQDLDTVESITNSPEIVPEVSRYNIPWGSGGINFHAGLQALYVDNVFLTHTATRDDFILVPKVDAAALFPIGQSNTIAFDIGLAYYEYLRNSSLNTGAPAVNPNSDLAFNVHTGDFTFRFDEGFSYQVLPFYETQNEFFNLFNTAQFRRFQNRVGVTASWDLHDLVITAGYHHENLWADGSTYEFIDRASEIFNADAMLRLSPHVSVGLETAGSLNNFDNSPVFDTSRARVGPAIRLNVSQFFKVEAGAGYERINFDSSPADSLGLGAENTYYAYGRIEHRLSHFFSHSLEASHDNQVGFNAANLEGTHVSYSLTWKPTKMLTISPRAELHLYNESFGPNTGSLYQEKFTYIAAGLNVVRQFGQHWRASVGWEYNLDNADVAADGYAQNIVKTELLYNF